MNQQVVFASEAAVHVENRPSSFGVDSRRFLEIYSRNCLDVGEIY